MKTDLFSIRMRATCNGRHCSGAERIVTPSEVEAVSAALVRRATKGLVAPDDIRCVVEKLDRDEIIYATLPDLMTVDAEDCATGREVATRLLQKAGVSLPAIEEAVSALAEGAAPNGEVMRGAMILDAKTGQRLETDRSRGVRVSRMDLDPVHSVSIAGALAEAGLSHQRTREALVLSGKVLRAPGIVAELCWSDDPSYLTGYVADPHNGYQRITPLKCHDDPRGGRAFFVDTVDWDQHAFVDYLESVPVLFNRLGRVMPTEPRTVSA